MRGRSIDWGEMAMPEYSISQLGTFEECALQYRLIYVDRIKRYERMNIGSKIGGHNTYSPHFLRIFTGL
jgi:hypothetical protein